MANYNHEILVNYLRDVYSMELLVRKIEDDIHSTREDIQCEQALVEKVESTPIPAEGNISPKKDITPYMIAGFLILFISFGFFTLPSMVRFPGFLVLVFLSFFFPVLVQFLLITPKCRKKKRKK